MMSLPSHAGDGASESHVGDDVAVAMLVAARCCCQGDLIVT
jgi:hypothetical protein